MACGPGVISKPGQRAEGMVPTRTQLGALGQNTKAHLEVCYIVRHARGTYSTCHCHPFMRVVPRLEVMALSIC